MCIRDSHLLSGLRRAGTDPQVPGGAPGLAVALGGVGLNLQELVQLYAAIGNNGVAVDLRMLDAPTPGFAPQPVMNPAAAWQIGHILQEAPRPGGVLGEGSPIRRARLTATAMRGRLGSMGSMLWAFGWAGQMAPPFPVLLAAIWQHL